MYSNSVEMTVKVKDVPTRTKCVEDVPTPTESSVKVSDVPTPMESQ